MLKIEIIGEKCTQVLEGTDKELTVEPIIALQILAKSFAQYNGITEDDAIDLMAESAKHFMNELKKQDNFCISIKEPPHDKD